MSPISIRLADFLTNPFISNTKTDKNSSDSCLAMRRITWIELTFVISLFSSIKLNESALRSSSAYGHVTIKMKISNHVIRIRPRYEPDIVMAVCSPILSTDTSCSVFLMEYHKFRRNFRRIFFSKQVTSVIFSLLYNHHLWSVLNHFFRVFFKNFEIFEMWLCLVNRGQLWLWINPCVSESREWLIFRLF